MSLLNDLIIPFISALVAAYLAIKYSAYVSNRQEKAILVLFAREMLLQFRRSGMYYRQHLEDKISYSTLFEITDSSAFVKFAELVKNNKVLNACIVLKATFFQVIRYTDKASEAISRRITDNKDIALEASSQAKHFQLMALNFFIGDLIVDGNFYRQKYKELILDMNNILDYIERLNSPSTLKIVITQIMPRLGDERASTDNFIQEAKSELQLITQQLDLLREKEEIYFLRNNLNMIVDKLP